MSKKQILSQLTIRSYEAETDDIRIREILQDKRLTQYLESEGTSIAEYLFYIRPSPLLTGYAVCLEDKVVGVRTFYVTAKVLKFEGMEDKAISMSSLIDPDYQNIGIGKYAFALTVIDYLDKYPDVKRLHARSEISNVAPNRIIQSMGLSLVSQEPFEDTGMIDNCYTGTREDILKAALSTLLYSLERAPITPPKRTKKKPTFAGSQVLRS